MVLLTPGTLTALATPAARVFWVLISGSGIPSSLPFALRREKPGDGLSELDSFRRSSSLIHCLISRDGTCNVPQKILRATIRD